MIKLSIITINYNNVTGLKNTMESVLSQSFKDYEYIVIDGDSDDGSVELLKNSTNLDVWISEKDNGIYDAMNKGIKRAEGQYLMFLNSGDCLDNNDVLEECQNAIKKFPETDIF